MAKLSHIDDKGNAHMVDVSEKDVTSRTAVARGSVWMQAETLTMIREGLAKKGDVIGTAALLGGNESTTVHTTEPIELLMLDHELVAPFVADHATMVSTTATVMLPASSKTLVRAIAGEPSANAGPTPAVDVRATMRMTVPLTDT